MHLAALREHLHTLPDHPAWIPYRTAYYNPAWGFCLSQDQLDAMPEGEYEVRIDSTLEPGHLTYGECVVPGRATRRCWSPATSATRRWPTTTCPGSRSAAELARELAAREHRYTYRFVFAPGTIGSLTWLVAQRRGRGAGARTAWC